MMGRTPGAEIAMLRQGCYRLLSRGFAPPAAADGDGFAQAGAVLDGLGLDAFAFAPFVWEWLDRRASAEWRVLDGEYIRLFDSTTDGALCRSAESQHLSVSRRDEAGAIAAGVDAALRAYGGRADDRRPADHVGWQLELGARMCERERRGAERCDESERVAALFDLRALTDRLQGWVPGLHRALVRHDRTGVYASLGGAAVAFITHEADLIRRAVETGVSA